MKRLTPLHLCSIPKSKLPEQMDFCANTYKFFPLSNQKIIVCFQTIEKEILYLNNNNKHTRALAQRKKTLFNPISRGLIKM